MLVGLRRQCGPRSAGEQLLVNKQHKELLEGYQQRQDAAINFVLASRPGLQVLAGPLLDPKVLLLSYSSPKP